MIVERDPTRFGPCRDRACSFVGVLHPVRVREGGRFVRAWYCRVCAEMIRAFNARGRA